MISQAARRFRVQRTCLALAAIFVSTGIASADPIGEWMVEKGYAKVRIENCGDSLWGAVSWEQTPGVDSKNPDPGKRTRPTLGMPVLLDMKPTEPNKWVGQIYNSENGQTYSSNISIGSSPDILVVRGCVLGVLCGGEDWKRVNDPSQPTTSTVPGGSPSGRTGNGTATASSQSRAVDIATASVNEFCSAVLLNSSGPPH
ncbi:MAG: DUF2147 domain-containing protein [Bradyrhizobiaceae bacterium]|nr:DUF2147 domain-containing protein [Bradyrhizobiaceae bacterium]